MAEGDTKLQNVETGTVETIVTEIVAEVEKAITGKSPVIRRAVLALLCNGHLLIEDIPGVGKTTLAKSLAKAIGGDFRRMQFTPDMLPSDVTGASIFNQQTSGFEFRPGPIFGNVILVDEINRATPKTQSALLEAMEERHVSVDGVTRDLPRPFFVIATQNNIEMTGTFPLPEAQLDRFFGRISLGYPDRVAEVDILRYQQSGRPLEEVKAVCDPETMAALQRTVSQMFVHESVRQYIVDVVRATREHSLLTLGASPRGSLFLLHAAQAHAAMNRAEFVRPDDVKEVAPMVLAHRVIARGEVLARGSTNEQIIEQVLDSVPAPVPMN